MDHESESKARGALVRATSLSLIGHGIVSLFLWSGVWPDLKRLPVPAILEVELQNPIRFEARAASSVSRPRSSPASARRLGGQRREKASVGEQAGRTPALSPNGRMDEIGGKTPSTEPLGKLTSASGESTPSHPLPSSNPSTPEVVPSLREAQAVSQDRQVPPQQGLGEDNGRWEKGEGLTGALPAPGAAVCCSRSGREGVASTEGGLTRGLQSGIGNGVGGELGGGEGGNPGGTGARDLDRLLLDYLQTLHRRISKHSSYPLQARRLGMEGTVTVGLTVRCDGQLAQVELIQSAPFTDLNMAAFETVKKVTPLPPPPVGTCQERMRVLVPFTYRLER